MLNSAKTSVRNELFSQANLISAIRLPNNLFSDNAGTEVGSDLIILQKNLHKTEMSQDERLLTVIQTDTKTNLTDNAYFIHHPERIVHTTAKLDTDPYGKPLWSICTRAKPQASPGICAVCLTRTVISGLPCACIRRNRQARERLAVEAKVEPQTAKLETVSSARAEEIHVDKPQTQPIKEKPEIEPRQQNHSAAVQLTLLDLWGMPIEEPVKKKKATKKENKPKRAIPKPKPPIMAVPPVESVKPATESKEQSRKMQGSKATLKIFMPLWIGKPIRPSTASMKR